MPNRDLDADYLTQVLDLAPAMIFVFDETLTITWANDAATNVLGYELDETLGRSILDFIDIDWNQEAMESIAAALAGSGIRLPMSFRLLAKDGSQPIVEATANVQLDNPNVRGIVVYARMWNERWLLDLTLDSVAAGEPIEDTLDLLVQVAGADTMQAPASFVYDRVDERATGVVASPDLPVELRGPGPSVTDEVATQWAALLGVECGTINHVHELAEPLRSIADSAGFRSLWIWPADHDDQRHPMVWAIAWRHEANVDADETRSAMMARLATLAALALGRWRNEIANAFAAAHDDMTGLHNRASVFEYVTTELATVDGHLGLVYLDLDDFKQINDRFGHAAGDRLLIGVAQRFADAAPVHGMMGRFGGDEFVYAGLANDIDQVERIASTLVQSLAEPFDIGTGEPVRIDVSVGSALGRRGVTTADELIEIADRALYRAKGKLHRRAGER